MHAALKFAHEAIKLICGEFEKFGAMVNKPKREVALFEVDKDLAKKIEQDAGKEIEEAICNPDKATRESALKDLQNELVAKFSEAYVGDEAMLAQLPEAVDKVVKGKVRHLILADNKRPDGRALDEIRPLEACAGLLPRVHGSGLFTRGQTQVMTVCTLGLPNDAQVLDGLEEEDDKRYMHFYNFPPYSVGETRPMRGPGRREVGHGALAERALRPMIPLDDPEFPYTLLLISEVLESNGSTSMASVCGSTLALMDAGIQIKAPVAGIAMGLMSDGKTFKVLTDIQGMEDFCGDMDFKVAGTRNGITALQLDTKLEGIPDKVLADALNQALKARLQILDVIEAEISAPRDEVASTAPRVYDDPNQPGEDWCGHRPGRRRDQEDHRHDRRLGGHPARRARARRRKQRGSRQRSDRHDQSLDRRGRDRSAVPRQGLEADGPRRDGRVHPRTRRPRADRTSDNQADSAPRRRSERGRRSQR